MDRVPHTLQTYLHLFAATLAVVLPVPSQTFSQSHDAAFGVVQILRTPVPIERCLLLNGQKPEKRRLLLWTPGSSSLLSTSLPLSDSTTVFREQFLTNRFDDIIPIDINGDGLQELLIVQREEKRLLIIENLDADTLKPVTILSLSVSPTHVLVGDLNNDRRQDILVADRNNPGIVPYLGTARGQFRLAPTIAPDNAVADMVLVYLNNDLLLDLIFYDWVKSELHFSYGVGRGRFVDLTTQPVEGSVTKIVARPSDKRRFMDLVLILEKPAEMQLWEGDVAGDFHKKQTVRLNVPGIDVGIADVNNDGWNDVVLLDRSGVLKVALNTSEESSTLLEYAAGRDATQLLLDNSGQHGMMDALIVQRDRGLLLFHNAFLPNVLRDSLTYATGVEPHGLWVGDLNGDGRRSIMLVNSGSGTLSLFAARGEEGLLGQTTVPLAAGPREFGYHSETDSTIHFFVSYPSTQSISYLTVHRGEFATVNAVIPDVGEMELLSANTTANHQAEFFCYSSSSASRSPSLVFYQQLEPRTFIERTFRLSIPDVLLGAGIGDFNHDGNPDVVFAYTNNELKRNELVFSLGDSALSFKNRYQTLFVPDGNLRKTYMWLKDFGHHDTLDLLMAFPPPASFIALAKGTSNGRFDAPVQLRDNIMLNDRSELQIVDLNDDTIPDIALYNSATNSLGWYQGIGNGTFSDWKPLVQSADIGHFAFGDLNGDGILDLAVTLSAEGRLKVYDGKLLFGKRGAVDAK